MFQEELIDFPTELPSLISTLARPPPYLEWQINLGGGDYRKKQAKKGTVLITARARFASSLLSDLL